MAMPKDGSQAVNREMSNQKQGRSGSMGQDFRRKFDSNPTKGGGIHRTLKKPAMKSGRDARNKNV